MQRGGHVVHGGRGKVQGAEHGEWPRVLVPLRMCTMESGRSIPLEGGEYRGVWLIASRMG